MTEGANSKPAADGANSKPAASVLRSMVPDFVVASITEIGTIYETTRARIERLLQDPSNVWDEISHIRTDVLDRAWFGTSLLFSLLLRDLFSFESIAGENSVSTGQIVLAETYFWAALCLLAYESGEIVGGWSVLGSGLQSVMNRTTAFVLGVVILPLFTHTWLRKSQISDDTRRMWTFVYAFLIGVFLSYSEIIAFDLEKEIMIPPLFVSPFLMGCMCTFAAYYGSVSSIRILLLVLCFVYYMAMSTLHRFDSVFLLWSLTFWTTSVVFLQLKIGRLKRRWASESTEQWATTIAFIGARLVFRILLVRREPSYPPMRTRKW